MIYLVLSLIQAFAFSSQKEFSTWNSLQSVKYENTIESEDIALFVPANIPAETENDRVGKKVMDHTFRNLLKGKLTPDATIFRTIEKVEENLDYEIALPVENEGDIQHKFKVQYRPFQNIARVKYDGLFSMNFDYDMDESFAEYSIHKTLGKDVDLSVVQSKDGSLEEGTSALTMVNLSLAWH